MQVRSGEVGRARTRAQATEELHKFLRKEIVGAVELLEPLLKRASNDAQLKTYAEIDLRALATIRTRLETCGPERLRELILWLVQIAMHWQIRMRDGERVIRQIIDLKRRLAN
ncbi:MAG TPA: hypothetical protein VF342_03005 [Alphaproteobacteria bacterium]